MDQFIEIAGVAVNVAQISFIDFRSEGIATVHFGSDSVTAKDGDIAKLRALFIGFSEPDPADPATAAGPTPELPAAKPAGRPRKTAPPALDQPV